MSKTLRAYLIAAGLVSLLLFYGFSRYVKNGGLKQADFDTTVKIQERIDKSSRLRLASAVGNVMEGSTFFASPFFASVIVVLLTIAAFWDRRNKTMRFGALAVPVLFALLVLGEVYGKNVVHHPSPPFFMIKNPTTIFPKDYVNEQYSYPSGHTARAAFIGVIVAILIGRLLPLRRSNALKWGVVGSCILVYIGIVAVARIYLGHHWLSDIVGGGLLGIGMSVLASAFL